MAVSGRHPHTGSRLVNTTAVDLVEVLLYVHRNRRLIRDGSPGRPPGLSHNSDDCSSLARRLKSDERVSQSLAPPSLTGGGKANPDSSHGDHPAVPPG